MELVYFLHANHTSVVKIGWTANVTQRIQKLRLSCPYGVRLLGVRPGPRELETAYHERFNHIRENGEWFHFDHEILYWLEVFLRTEYAEAWDEVCRLFNEETPELVRIEDRYGTVSSVLDAGISMVDPVEPRRMRRPRTIIHTEAVDE